MNTKLLKQFDGQASLVYSIVFFGCTTVTGVTLLALECLHHRSIVTLASLAVEILSTTLAAGIPTCFIARHELKAKRAKFEAIFKVAFPVSPIKVEIVEPSVNLTISQAAQAFNTACLAEQDLIAKIKQRPSTDTATVQDRLQELKRLQETIQKTKAFFWKCRHLASFAGVKTKGKGKMKDYLPTYY